MRLELLEMENHDLKIYVTNLALQQSMQKKVYSDSVKNRWDYYHKIKASIKKSFPMLKWHEIKRRSDQLFLSMCNK